MHIKTLSFLPFFFFIMNVCLNTRDLCSRAQLAETMYCYMRY